MTKSPLQSRTIWTGLFTTIAGVLSIYNPVAGELISANSELILTALGAVIVILRTITTKAIK